ncbi:hypothetical protein PtA15_1A438 [Puccinia triticina]|uniref:Uncharacterized protein n=1 Tax=Puccinia triticina TaxID=208348 RepID=A0ABY7C7F6_9BASI|nr:uncharacterized protein PtA15_1A438 [Puccinia triticina]WAQ81100.1 hypothetical protein PtA15_1A438 [Puccinia triticina]WAR51992.1 hypothetical protein PtB15_1B430 [Puccinia triticina]
MSVEQQHLSSAFISAAVSALQTARIPVVTSHPDCQKAVLANPTASDLVPLPTGPPLKAYTFALPVTRMPSPGCLCKTMPTSPCQGNGSTLTLEHLTFNHLCNTSPGVLEDLSRINPHKSDSRHLQAQRQPSLRPLTARPQPHPDSDRGWQKHHKQKLRHYFNTLAQHPLSSNRRELFQTGGSGGKLMSNIMREATKIVQDDFQRERKLLIWPPQESKIERPYIRCRPRYIVGHPSQAPRAKGEREFISPCGQPSSAREIWVVSSPPALLQEPIRPIPLSPTLNEFSSIRTRKALEEELGLSAGDTEAVKRRTSTSKACSDRNVH